LQLPCAAEESLSEGLDGLGDAASNRGSDTTEFPFLWEDGHFSFMAGSRAGVEPDPLHLPDLLSGTHSRDWETTTIEDREAKLERLRLLKEEASRLEQDLNL